MIKKVTLKNIQRHKNIVFDFVNGLNIIIGDNNKGKSTIVRSINWALRNRPLGTWMVRKGVGKCSVTIDIDDSRIIRTRGKRVNKYTVDGDEYNDIAGKVPEKIGLLKFSEIRTGKINLFPNIAFTPEVEQLFMVNESSGIKYSVLAYITGCDKVEKAVRTYKNRIRDVNSRLVLLHEQRVLDEQEILKYTKLHDIRLLLGGLDTENKRMNATEQDLAILQKMEEKYTVFGKEIRRIRDTLESIERNGFSSLEDLLNKVVSVQGLFLKLTDLLTLENYIKRCKEDLEKVDKDTLEKDFGSLEEMEKELELLNGLAVIYEEIVMKRDVLERIKKDLAKYPNCPMCGAIRKAV